MELLETTQCSRIVTENKRGKSGIKFITLWIGFLIFGLLISYTPVSAASSSNSTIISVLDQNDYLLDDGTLWSKGNTSGVWTQNRNLIGISKSDDHSIFGWTAAGEVIRWDKDNAHIPETKQFDGVVSVYGHGLVLLQDGNLYTFKDKAKVAESIIDVSSYRDKSGKDSSYSALSSSGDVYYANYNKIRKAGNVPDGKRIATNGVYAAVLKNDGSVVIVSMLYEDKQIMVADNVKSLIWWGDTHKLLTVKQDGTVWGYDRTAKYKGEQLPGLSNVSQMVYAPRLDELYAQLQDGAWAKYDNGKLVPLSAPTLNQVTLLASSKKANIGDTVSLTLLENYSNGFKNERVPLPEEIIVEQPQVAQIQAGGKLKVTGMGTTKVTFKTGDQTSSVQLNVDSQQQNLTGSTLLEGNIYLPVQSVFKTLGAKVVVKGSTFEIQFGDDRITLQKGSAIAQFNNKELKLKGKVQTIGGQTVFPADLLRQTAGIQVQWDAELKQAKVLVGDSSIVVESKDTSALLKKKELGNLSRFIGKSYWINSDTSLGQRFSKVTITDIKIEKSNSDRSYTVVFRNAKGKTVTAYAGGAPSSVTEMLADSDQFFSSDPYKKYNWSQSTWNKIIAREVALGMNMTQARLAWGDPTSISYETSSKGKIEAWVYASSAGVRALGFANGKLIVIY